MFLAARKSRRLSALFVVGPALLGAALLSGCKGNGDEQSMLMQENAELRSQLQQTEAAAANAESRAAAAESEAAALRQQGTQPGTRSANTGFEGISGITVSSGSGEVIVGIAGDVLFDSGQITLKNTSKRTLDRVAQVLQSQYPGRTIRVEGYTDSDPIKKSNWKTNERLSAERAMAVETYLVTKGVDNTRIYSAAFGPASPKGSKNESRRVEIVIVDSQR